jgi:3-deoxy-D-manno-octulosonic-acid transferase
MTGEGRVYDAVAGAAPWALGLAAPFSAKLRRGLAGRRGALAALEAWAAAARDPDRPLYWLHAPSVGEALMAQAIVAALRQERPAAQFAFTFFSPSAERVAPRVGADVAAYLPWDTRSNSRAALAALRPGAIGFIRTEIWPGLVREAGAADVPVLLLNAALGADSSRVRGPGRRLLAPSYRRLAAVGAVSEADAARFPRLGVAPGRVTVTGDARFDQVLERVAAIDRGAPLLRRLADGVHTIAAGSTWPADEARLVPALASLRGRWRFRLVAAPHEPSEAHVAGLERRLRAHGFAAARLGAVEASDTPLPDAVVVDRIGVLAELYALAHSAYVGGGFGTAGLHSVVEPAALGVPVAYGPAFGNAQEAAALAAAGGGRVASGGTVAAAATALAAIFDEWLGDETRRAAASESAARFVAERRGGALRNARLLLGVAP